MLDDSQHKDISSPKVEENSLILKHVVDVLYKFQNELREMREELNKIQKGLE